MCKYPLVHLRPSEARIIACEHARPMVGCHRLNAAAQIRRPFDIYVGRLDRANVGRILAHTVAIVHLSVVVVTHNLV